jgi:hypothetical protein
MNGDQTTIYIHNPPGEFFLSHFKLTIELGTNLFPQECVEFVNQSC